MLLITTDAKMNYPRHDAKLRFLKCKTDHYTPLCTLYSNLSKLLALLKTEDTLVTNTTCSLYFLFSKYLLSTYGVSDTVIGTGVLPMNKK